MFGNRYAHFRILVNSPRPKILSSDFWTQLWLQSTKFLKKGWKIGIQIGVYFPEPKF